MSRNLLLNMAAGVCILMPASFVAAEEGGEPASLRLSHGVWRYDMNTLEEDNGTTTTKTESSGFTTFPGDVELAAFVGEYSVYIYPQDMGGNVLFGKAFDNQEAGLSLGINSRSVKDGDESSENSIGGYYFYSRPLSNKVTFEFDISPTYFMGSEKNTTGGTPPTTQEADISGYSLYLDLLGVVPIAKNFEYVFGIDYTYTKTDIKVKGGTTLKNTDTNLGLILAKFRFFI
ncbi:hypothetical protein [Oligoflexus tunisiensis]|uniref:hypothetical protein n=1 Tax=Oligoflexus tunisiensis TaxID=708132 RepID=UPI00114CCC3B|nr:hypothetical protein [Oligoflexus tunisiensis]